MSTQQGRADDRAGQLHRLGGVLLYGRRALALVWQTSPGLTLALATFTVLAGALPALAAWIGQLIVDAVVAALALHREGQSPELGRSEEHTSELQSRGHLVCRLLLEKK